MPSPIPATRLLKDLYPTADTGTCSSPLSLPGRSSSSLQVPAQRHQGRASGRPRSSAVRWDQLRSVEPVGSGGFGSVYRAEYLGETVALKTVKKSSKNRLASRQSFWAELNAAHLQHKNIVRVIAATTCVPEEAEGGIGAVLMEFVGSSNLQQIIYGDAEPLLPSRALRFAADVADGLRFLHSHGVVHLDLKPANVLVSRTDVCKIADFGCSLKLDRDGQVTGAHLSQVCGTYTHRAPELLRGEPVSSKADIFSFGITLWQLLTRDPPYTGDRQHVLYAVVKLGLRPSVRKHPVFRSDAGRRCASLLDRCWSSETRCRPTATRLLEEMQDLQDLDLSQDQDLNLVQGMNLDLGQNQNLGL